MDLSGPRPRDAVLIDARNVFATHAPALFARIAARGDARLRRVYSDFSGSALSPWKAMAHACALSPQHCLGQAAGQNGADIALAIDAMELMHERLFDIFRLVSSDSDFTRLALRLRERGARVHGFGEAKTLESFRAACDRFHVLRAAGPATAVATRLPRGSAASEPATSATTEIRPASDALPLIEKALAASRAVDGRWVGFGALGSQLSKDPAYRLEDYGVSQLGKLVAKIEALETRTRADGGQEVRLRKTA